jgi:hypothetical protein
MSAKLKERGPFVAVLAIAALAVVALSVVAVEIMGEAAIGGLLGVLVVLAVLGLRQQWRYARRSAADLAAVSRALAAADQRAAKTASAMSKEVTQLSRTVTTWSKDVKVAEIETGIAALNRYVALGSNDTIDQA